MLWDPLLAKADPCSHNAKGETLGKRSPVVDSKKVSLQRSLKKKHKSSSVCDSGFCQLSSGVAVASREAAPFGQESLVPTMKDRGRDS